jgi:hypothetical protein
METFLNLAKLVLTDGSTPMIPGGVDTLHISLIVLTLLFLTLRIVNKKSGRSSKTFRAASAPTNHGASGGFLERRRIPALKNCPNCAEQLPLSALICDACDYNFLATRPGRGQQLLPPPHEMPEPRIAAAGL